MIAEVPPAPADRRPVYVTAKGTSGGSYLRGGDGDRHLTESEIALVVAARVQPLYDREPVEGSSTNDLDDEFFPQLMVTIVVHAAEQSSGTRFLDNQTVRGSIPEMV